jgi:ABC-type glycerol-3-phosphate transport system substrate-binding protein
MFQSILKKITPDKLLFLAALAVLAAAFIVTPKEPIRIMKTGLNLASASADFIPQDELEALINEFETNNQGITVTISDETPDIVIFNPLLAPALDGQNPITDKTLLAASINPLFYNILMLKSEGFDRPPKTRDDFLAVCRKMKASGKKNQFAYSFSKNIFTSILPWFYAAALQNDTESGVPDIDWTSRAAIETFAFFNLLYEEKLIDGASLDKDEGEVLDDFLNGKTTMMTGPSTLIKKIKKIKSGHIFNVTTIPSPAAYRGRPMFNLSVLYIGIVENPEKKAEAGLFAAFMKEKQREITGLLGAVPGNLSETLESSGGYDADPLLEKTGDLYEGSIVIDESTIFPQPHIFAEAFKAELKKMWSGTQTPSECATAVAAAAP